MLYDIATTNGAHLREIMRSASDETVAATLERAARYIGIEREIERLDDGRIALGPLVATPARCESEDATGEPCDGRASRMIEWMPPQHRESHEAAGNAGSYPHNGARRMRCCDACATLLVDDDGAIEVQS